MQIIKTIIYILLFPIVFIFTMIICLVYGKDKDTLGWYQTVWTKGSLPEKVLAVIITPIVVPIAFIMEHFFKYWDKLVD